MVAGIDLTGQKFGKLVVVKLAVTGKRRKWLCLCECGKDKIVDAGNLRSGNSKACGYCAEPNLGGLRHGHTSSKNGVSPTYVSWRAMRVRCSNAKRDGAQHYVERGITCDPRWGDFSEFLRDMGERPEGMTLDRIDNDLGYSKGNCRWATPFQQTHNRRRGWKRRPNDNKSPAV